jgi:capsular polysaccharide biosynthesis protein
MSITELLIQDTLSIRKMPVNIINKDIGLFQHEFEKVIPAAKLISIQKAKVSPDGIITKGLTFLPESFASPNHISSWIAKILFLTRNPFFKHHAELNQDVYWITDTWSKSYFHWMTDVLPKIYLIKNKIIDQDMLLPACYKDIEYVRSSLIPFAIEIKFIDKTYLCSNLLIPTKTAPTGNYNESIIRSLRDFYTKFYLNSDENISDKIYISRRKARRRRLTNENEVIEVLIGYGFKVVLFEDCSFEQQVQIALNAKHIISNHGAGLTNIMFMKSGGCVFEIRKEGDMVNNCYFALASALHLRYFYQTCNSEIPNEDAHTANLIVDCDLLKINIEKMLAS